MQVVPFVMKDDNGRVLNTSFIGNDSKEIMTFVSLSTSDHFNLCPNYEELYISIKIIKLLESQHYQTIEMLKFHVKRCNRY